MKTIEVKRELPRIPHYDWLTSFIISAEKNSFTLASRDLNQTQAAISKHITKLESMLCVKLFHRNGNVIRLTPDGERFYSEIKIPYFSLRNSILDFNNSSQNFNLNIETEPVISKTIISSHLPKFLSSNPNVLINEVLTTNTLEFSDNTELAIKWGEMDDWEDFDVKFLTSLCYVPVCSPEYQQSKGLFSAKDLCKKNVHLIHDRDTTDWQYWSNKYSNVGLQVGTGHTVGQSDLLAEFAKNGIGVALCGIDLIREQLDEKKLIIPFPKMSITHHKAYYILTRKGASLSTQAVRFISFLYEEIGGNVGYD
ncbi:MULTISPECIES: LysR substrate-binding domain-containing protein [Vibrio]|uniref:LysR family transcriptional regulator n=2 Tax=Vibrio TaxID=662 RepID=A0A4U1ZCD6_9VIBR|nr:LysR family transcriptional regulator [Vibrio kanaloae]TKF32295.1 LysR family transcriptional regulator [Vibrio kanaloae]TKF74959.1 LysR family transcriptional regulator [Vibrio kanaloae]